MRIVKLSEVVDELESGSRPKGGVSTETGTIPSLGGEHLSDEGGFNFHKNKYISLDFFENIRAGKIKIQDILIVKDGATTGRVSFVGENFPYSKAAINEHVFRISIKKDIGYPKYVYLFLKSGDGKKQLLNDFRGATVGGISRQFIELTKIPLPPLSEQIHIANVLSKAEALIAKRKESMALLDAYLKSTFLEMFGDPVRNEKGWEVKRIDEMCLQVVDCPHNTPNYEDNKTEYFCIRSSDIQNGYLNLEETLHVDFLTFNDRNSRYIPAYNDVVFTREGGRLGNAARIPKNLKVCLGQRIMLFVIDKRKMLSEYFWSSINSSSIQQLIQNLSGGGAAPRINIKDIIKIQFAYPPLELQNQFAAIVEKVEALKETHQESLRELEALYGSLSQRAFRGELGVGGDEDKINEEIITNPSVSKQNVVELSFDQNESNRNYYSQQEQNIKYSKNDIIEILKINSGNAISFEEIWEEIKGIDNRIIPSRTEIQKDLLDILDSDNSIIEQIYDTPRNLKDNSNNPNQILFRVKK